MTSGERSALARAADAVLLLPKAQEACPHGLAPTTSTLMQLALGDAIAVALLEARGFTATDFKTFHPGGKLGASLSHIGDIMHSGENMPLVGLGTPMPEAVHMLAQKRYGCVGVVNGEGILVGIVSRADLLRVFLRRDRVIREEISGDILERTLGIGSDEVVVAVTDGRVSLRGTVERRELIPVVLRLCEQVDGVVEVTESLDYRTDEPVAVAGASQRPGVLP